jgi:secondary thiamine-phosphate synthase enzyme
MKSFQKEIRLRPYPRGFHLITRDIVDHLPEIKEIESGIFHLFIKHTSASLTINENADPTVRQDFATHIDGLFPDEGTYIHDYEGKDDMPAHLKSSVLGSSITIPITNGRLNLGTWQGIYLCEHRNHGGSRIVVATGLGLQV